MNRKRTGLATAVLSVGLCVLGMGAQAEAATISIGQFLWFEEGSGFGPKLTITNSSNNGTPNSPAVSPGLFTDVSVLLHYFQTTGILEETRNLGSLGIGPQDLPFLTPDPLYSPDVLRYARLSLTFGSQSLSLLLCADPSAAPCSSPTTVDGSLQIDITDPFDFRQWDPTGAGYDQRSASASIDIQVADPPAVVPEPASLMLLGTGLAGLAIAQRRRRRLHG